MIVKFLGTGTSQGVPVIGCTCTVCESHDSKDKRFRSSVIISTDDDQKLLIDCSPDFRSQMLSNNETKVDAVLITHEHNDHVIGLDDMRPIIFKSEELEMPIYCQQRVVDELKTRFQYAFSDNKYPGVPSFKLHRIRDNFTLKKTLIEPIEILHGRLPILGYKIDGMAYITDASSIASTEKKKLHHLDILIVNCLRKNNPHHSHFILEDVINLYDELKPKKMYLTHISHEFGLHTIEQNLLPENIYLAYDGLEINI